MVKFPEVLGRPTYVIVEQPVTKLHCGRSQKPRKTSKFDLLVLSKPVAIKRVACDLEGPHFGVAEDPKSSGMLHQVNL
jgi:hypothetical protein